jgi:hypothetical protein
VYAKRIPALSTEQQHELDALRERYYAECRPQDQRQLDTVDKLVDAEWRHLRYTAIEKWLVDCKMSEMRFEVEKMFSHEPDYDLRAALAYDRLYKESRTIEALQRERQRLVRTIQLLLKILRDLQKENPPQAELRNEPEIVPVPDAPEPQTSQSWPAVDTPLLEIAS